MWEFPGGKVEPGESAEQALVREIAEELSVEIEVRDELVAPTTSTWPASNGYRMRLFYATITQGKASPTDGHDSLRWLEKGELESVDWLPSDRAAIAQLSLESSTENPGEVETSRVLSDSFEVLASFFERRSFTSLIAGLETELHHADAAQALNAARSNGLTSDLLLAALTVRQRLGRLNDVIHATAIACLLPLILKPGETLVNKPSLAAGNDASRHFDLETSHRVAEVKVSVWKGSDSARQRGLFADLVNLTLDDTGRSRELYVVGERPGRFLVGSTRLGSEVLGKYSSYRTREAFAELGNEQMSVADFMASSNVDVIDISVLLPGLFPT